MGALLCSTVASAHADELRPTFVTLERGDTATQVGLEASLTEPEHPGDPSGPTTLWRGELYGQYVHASGWGAYAKLPVSYARIEPLGVGQVGSLRMHNAELGALYVVQRGAARVIGHVGLTLPTLADEPPIVAEKPLVHYRMLADLSRTEDALLSSASRLVAARFALSPVWRSGRVFARADLGVDIVLAGHETSDLRLSTVMARGGAGVGFAPITPLAFTAEVAIYNAGRTGSPESYGSLKTFAVSCHSVHATWELYAALSFPLEDREESYAATVGASANL